MFNPRVREEKSETNQKHINLAQEGMGLDLFQTPHSTAANSLTFQSGIYNPNNIVPFPATDRKVSKNNNSIIRLMHDGHEP